MIDNVIKMLILLASLAVGIFIGGFLNAIL